MLRRISFYFLFLTGCLENDSLAEVRSHDNILYISGPINPSIVRKIEQINLKKIKEITITSRGGDVGSAFKIAEIIEKKDIAVTAKDYCLSACASIIFMASSHRTVAPGTLFVWHSTATARIALFETLPEADKRNLSISDIVYKHAAMEKKLYRNQGINTDLLRAHNLWRNFICYFGQKNKKGNNIFYPVFEAAGYIPSNDDFDKFGINLASGKLPKGLKEVKAIIDRLGGEDNIPYLFFDDGSNLYKNSKNLDRFEKELSIRKCTDAEIDAVQKNASDLPEDRKQY